jgi:hypothetical protein
MMLTNVCRDSLGTQSVPSPAAWIKTRGRPGGGSTSPPPASEPPLTAQAYSNLDSERMLCLTAAATLTGRRYVGLTLGRQRWPG